MTQGNLKMARRPSKQERRMIRNIRKGIGIFEGHLVRNQEFQRSVILRAQILEVVNGTHRKHGLLARARRRGVGQAVTYEWLQGVILSAKTVGSVTGTELAP